MAGSVLAHWQEEGDDRDKEEHAQRHKVDDCRDDDSFRGVLGARLDAVSKQEEEDSCDYKVGSVAENSKEEEAPSCTSRCAFAEGGEGSSEGEQAGKYGQTRPDLGENDAWQYMLPLCSAFKGDWVNDETW